MDGPRGRLSPPPLPWTSSSISFPLRSSQPDCSDSLLQCHRDRHFKSSLQALLPSIPSFLPPGPSEGCREKKIWEDGSPGLCYLTWESSMLSSQDTPQGWPGAMAGRWLRWDSGGREGNKDRKGVEGGGERWERHRGVETRQRKTSCWLTHHGRWCTQRFCLHTSLLVPADDPCPSPLQSSPRIIGNTHMDQMALHPHPSFPYKSTFLCLSSPIRPPTFLSKEDLGAPPHLSVGEIQVLRGGSNLLNGGQAMHQVGFLVAQVQRWKLWGKRVRTPKRIPETSASSTQCPPPSPLDPTLGLGPHHGPDPWIDVQGSSHAISTVPCHSNTTCYQVSRKLEGGKHRLRGSQLEHLQHQALPMIPSLSALLRQTLYPHLPCSHYCSHTRAKAEPLDVKSLLAGIVWFVHGELQS